MAAMTMDLSGTRMRSGGRRSESVAERNRERMQMQRGARRGPTPEIFFTKHLDNTRIRKADDPVRQREMRMFSGVVVLLFGLLMLYVCQHASSVELGYQLEQQRAEVQKLQEANRQLRLSEAQLTEPGRIDRMAKQLGLDEPQPGQVVGVDGSVANAGAPVMASVSAGGLGLN